MINFTSELKEILKNDPLDILRNTTVQPITSDQRLKKSFEEINDFIDHNGHEPTESTNISERKLFSRLKQLRKDFEKASFLKDLDRHELLVNVRDIKNVEDILEKDVLGILDNNTENIFDIKNIPKTKAKTDFYARRKPCNNFSYYEPKFKQIQNDLNEKKRKLIFFKESHLREGQYYVLDGILLYLEKIDEMKIKEFNDKSQGKRKRIDPRTRCIFENGLESNMYLRSLSKELYNNGSTIIQSNEETLREFDEGFSNITSEDRTTGKIYILSSLSKRPEIKFIENLYKIGFTTLPIEKRIQNAENETTFLMAKVKIISLYKTYNLNPQKFESIIHQIFSKRCLDVKIADKNGKLKNPKEWYIAPIRIIEQVIQLIINKKIQNYKFDHLLNKLIEKKNS